MKFYIAEGKVREKLLALETERLAVSKARQALAKRFNAKGAIVEGDRIVGLVFEGEPPSPWKLKKNNHGLDGFCAPDNSKAGSAIRSEMLTLSDVCAFEIAAAVGVPPLWPGRYTPAQYRVYGETIGIALDDRAKPGKDCRRISDVEFEALAKKKVRRKKAIS